MITSGELRRYRSFYKTFQMTLHVLPKDLMEKRLCPFPHVNMLREHFNKGNKKVWKLLHGTNFKYYGYIVADKELANYLHDEWSKMCKKLHGYNIIRNYKRDDTGNILNAFLCYKAPKQKYMFACIIIYRQSQ